MKKQLSLSLLCLICGMFSNNTSAAENSVAETESKSTTGIHNFAAVGVSSILMKHIHDKNEASTRAKKSTPNTGRFSIEMFQPSPQIAKNTTPYHGTTATLVDFRYRF